MKHPISGLPATLRILAATVIGGFCLAADPEHGASSNYLLSGSDVILVKVFQEPDLDSQHRISKDGTVTMPLIGVVNLGGKNVDEAANIIRDRLAKGYLRNPQVRVNIIQYVQRRLVQI